MAPPKPNRVLPNTERLSDPRTGPARQRQQHGARTVRLSTITRSRKSRQGNALLVAHFNQRLSAHVAPFRIGANSESQIKPVGQPTGICLGVGQGNVDGFAATANPDIKRLLGQDGDLGRALGLDNRWAYNAVKQVGNYGDMWERSITPIGLPRGLNALWTKGGLQFAPPLR